MTNQPLFSINEIVTFFIWLYGAILATIVYISTHVKIKIDLLKNMTSTATWEKSNYFKITNKAKESIYI